MHRCPKGTLIWQCCVYYKEVDGRMGLNHGELLICFFAIVQRRTERTEINKEKWRQACGRRHKKGGGTHRWWYLCHDTSSVQLARDRCCQPRGLDRLHLYCTRYYSTAQRSQNKPVPAHTNRGKLAYHKGKRGGWGVETQARVAMEKAQYKKKKKKKLHAACVNWLMLPPLCQINSTGQGREGGREKCDGVGGCVQSFHQRAFHSPLLSFSL